MDTAPPTSPPPPSPLASLPPTPIVWRLLIGAAVFTLGVSAFLAQDWIGPRGQSAVGVACFIGLAAMMSSNLRAVNRRTLLWGFGLQLTLALFVTQVPAGRRLFEAAGGVVKKFLEFSSEGATFVFGRLASPPDMDKVFGPTLGANRGFIFAFSALPTIIFVSSFFAVLYHFGVLQRLVAVVARIMRYLMRTSGAETVSVTASVFMGQTEAPLIVRPYVPRMTNSELLALMVSGMAHISGGLMAVYIGMGADPVAILTTSIMASPCSLYMAKLMMPELGRPETGEEIKVAIEKTHANVIDAAAAGASDGLHLALNVAAMLIAFIALIALVNAVMGVVPTGDHLWALWNEEDGLLRAGNLLVTTAVVAGIVLLLARALRHWLPQRWGPLRSALLVVLPAACGLVPLLVAQAVPAGGLSLQLIFSWVFSPVAFLAGVSGKDIPLVADLLGTKLVLNEFVAFTKYKEFLDAGQLSERGKVLSTFALTGFANFASIGIQLGGIGAMAPERRGDLARLGGKALLVGFLVTLVNASLAGVFWKY